MFKRFKPFDRSTIGIDLSPLCVKAIQISRTSEYYCIDHAIFEPLPSHAIIDNQIRDSEAVTACIKKFLSKTDSWGKEAILAVPNSAIVSKVIQISNKIQESEIEEFVFIEASKSFASSLNDVNLDFIIQGPSMTHKDCLDVLVMVCRAEQINSRVDVISRAGLIPKVVEMESNALERILPWLDQSSHQIKEKRIALINLSGLSASLYVIEDGKTIFSHEEAFVADQWLKNFSKAKETSSTSIYPISNQAILEQLLPQKTSPEVMMRQVKRMLQFFFSAHAYSIDHIFLLGEIANLGNFAQGLQDKMKITTSIANPFKRMKFSRVIATKQITEKASSLALACGLALRELD